MKPLPRVLAVVAVVSAVLGSVLGVAPAASAENNGVERTPVLGWSSWSYLRDNPTAQKSVARYIAAMKSVCQQVADTGQWGRIA